MYRADEEIYRGGFHHVLSCFSPSPPRGPRWPGYVGLAARFDVERAVTLACCYCLPLLQAVVVQPSSLEIAATATPSCVAWLFFFFLVAMAPFVCAPE